MFGKTRRGNPRCQWFGVVGAVCASTFGASDADADSAHPAAYALSFTWSAPDACPSRAAVVARARELGEAAFILSPPVSSAPAQPTPDGDVAVVEVDVVEHAGQFDISFSGTASGQPFVRQLRTSSCEEAAEATALLLAMMVQTESAALVTSEPAASDPAAPGSGAASATAASASTSEPVGSQPTATNSGTGTTQGTASRSAGVDNPKPPMAPRAPRSALARQSIAQASPRDAGTEPSQPVSQRWALGAAASANHALLPNTALGVVAHLAHQYRWLRVSMEGTWLPPVAQRLRVAPAVGARLSLWSTALRVGLWQPLKLGSAAGAWGVSLAAEVGQLQGRAYGTDHPTTRSVLWLAGSGGVGGLVKISATWATVALAEAVVPVTRTEFNLRNVGSIEAAAAVGARVRLGLEAQF